MEELMNLNNALAVAALSVWVLAGALPAEAGAPMPTGTAVVPPGGFIGFCSKHLPECRGFSQAPEVVELTASRRQQLDSVQARVNAAITWREDPGHQWDYPADGFGDCNKFALEKRRELIALGWPREALLLTTAVTEHGEGHLVLVARTSEGDLVLDNRLPPVVDWTRLPYRWVSRQSEQSPVTWLEINATPIAGEARVASTQQRVTDWR
jgi:predicted transglutaminase-like cysteine proteinase